MPERKRLNSGQRLGSIPPFVRIAIIGLFFMFAVVLLYFLRNVVAIVVFAVLLASIVEPFVTRLHTLRIPKWISMIIVYLFLLLISAGVLVLIFPTLIDQTTQALTSYAPYIEQMTGGSVNVTNILSDDIFEQNFDQLITSFQQSGLIDAVPQFLSVLSSAFGGMMTLFVIFILAFYLVVEENKLLKGLNSILSKKYRTFTDYLIPVLRKKVGRWIRGQLFIMFMIFLLTYTVLSVLGVPYALLLALLAGLFEILPFIGPMLSVIPAVVIALSLSPLSAFLVAFFYFIIQQIEAEILTPKVMQKAVGLNPVIIIIAVMVGFEIGSVVGAMLAIPITMITTVFVQELIILQKKS